MSASNLDLHSMSRFPFRYQDAITFSMKYRRIYTLDLFEGSFTFDFSCPPSTYVTGIYVGTFPYTSVYILRTYFYGHQRRVIIGLHF